MRLVEITLQRLSQFVRTSGSYDLIHEEHALMIEHLCDEVERLEALVLKKNKEIHALKLKQDLGLNIDRVQLSNLGENGDKSGRTGRQA